jgi:hypothetical protein
MAFRSDVVAIVLPGLCGDAVCSPLELLARSGLGSARLSIPVVHTLDVARLAPKAGSAAASIPPIGPHELRLSRTGQPAHRGRNESQVPLLRERRREIRGQGLRLGRSRRSRARGSFCHWGYVDDLLRRAHLRRLRIRPPVPGGEVGRVIELAPARACRQRVGSFFPPDKEATRRVAHLGLEPPWVTASRGKRSGASLPRCRRDPRGHDRHGAADKRGIDLEAPQCAPARLPSRKIAAAASSC